MFRHQDFDWDGFSSYEDAEFEIFLEKSKPFFAANRMLLPNDVFYVLFGSLISEYSFLKFLGLLADQKSKVLLNVNNFLSFKLNHSSSSLIDLKAFHRHPHFEREFRKAYATRIDSQDDVIRKSKKLSFFALSLFFDLKKYGLDCYGKSVANRLLHVLQNKDYLLKIQTPFNVLCSNHGIYNNHGALIMASSKMSGGKIFIIQPGFIHLQAKYIYQVKYELRICDSYFGWGDDKLNQKVKNIGSMYSYRDGDAKFHESAIIILPQVPSSTPRAFSFYWGSFADFELENKNILTRISEIITLHKSVVVRCKSCDYSYYSRLFSESNLKVNLVAGDINRNDHFDCHSHSYIFYFSTAIPEAYYKGSNVQLEFSSSSFLLKEEANLLSGFINEKPTNQEKLKCYLRKFAIPTTPKEYAKNLMEILVD